MARFWVGDLHLGHKKVAEIRFPELKLGEAVRVHDNTIMQQLLKLNSDDQVWVMGDISSGKPEDEDYSLELLKDVPAQLHLIAGNHDSVSGIHRNGYKSQRRWLEVFESVQDYTRWRIYGKQIMGSHYPYARSGDGPDRGEARYLEWRLPDVGLGLIHAHTHQTTPHMDRWTYDFVSQENVNLGPDLSQICVSWDARRGLVTEHELSEWAKELPK